MTQPQPSPEPSQPPSPGKPKRGRPPKQTQVGKARKRRPTTFKLPAFQDIATLTDAFVDKLIHMYKLAIVHDRAKSEARKDRCLRIEIDTKYLETSMAYEKTLSQASKAHYHQRKLQEAQTRHMNAETTHNRIQMEKVELEFKLAQCQKKLMELEKELEKSNNSH
ncbi:hypothetical protein RSOL_075100 [Rhizoctonia solani AG-3 Rhs1AP]|uniref:Uncharacterized protein n=1 Tax=Rhizoctonia solani AG-3 Rhs1AP TaxID=1086054 RepID=X8J019_9AGAM|nr:hypothetical protein RSOL_075100 [Rhizoctonia solani AG-3 Rhs1AP]